MLDGDGVGLGEGCRPFEAWCFFIAKTFAEAPLKRDRNLCF